MLPIPTTFPAANTHRVVLFHGDRTGTDFERVEDLAADAACAAREAVEALQDLPYDLFKPIQTNLARVAEWVRQRHVLSDDFRACCQDLLRDLARIEPDDTTARPIDHAMRRLRDALNGSHRVDDLLVAERDIGRARGFSV